MPFEESHTNPEYFNTKQAAQYLGLSEQFLEISRHKGEGPPFIKLARVVRYKKSDLDEWMVAQRRQHTAYGEVG